MSDGSPRARSRGRVATFAVVACTCAAVAVGYVAYRRRAVASTGAEPRSTAAELAAVAARPHVVFRDVARPESFGKVALAPLGAGAERPHAALDCARVHFAGGRGLCLEVTAADLRQSRVVSFDRGFVARWTTPITGLPSRVRVSPDGRYGAVTVFVVGHSYSDVDMSTSTLLVDLEKSAVIADLEELTVVRGGAKVEERDRNFWGVTFTSDANRFYATMSSGGRIWLVAGDVAARRLETMQEDIECPSLSPDGKRIAFKKRMPTAGAWRLHTLDLASGEQHLLGGETRFVDDQVEWLDDATILYKAGPDVYALSADDGTPPRVFLQGAASPAVVRAP